MSLNKLIINYKIKKGYRRNITYYDEFKQIGGKKRSIYLSDLILNNEKIIFEEIYVDDEKRLLLYELNNKKNNCILITINSIKKEAVIENLYVKDRKCINLTDFEPKNPGTFYLKVAIKMLKKYKDKFKINKIVLEDVATIECNNNDYPLSSLLLLTKGYAFYEKEGFIYSNKVFNTMLKKYKDFVKTIKLKDIKNIYDILKNNIYLSNLIEHNKDKNILDILQIIFSKKNIENNIKICKLYPKINNELIMFYQSKLGGTYIDLFAMNNKMELEI